MNTTSIFGQRQRWKNSFEASPNAYPNVTEMVVSKPRSDAREIRVIPPVGGEKRDFGATSAKAQFMSWHGV